MGHYSICLQFYHSLQDQSAAALLSAETIRENIIRANSREATYLLATTPGTDGRLPDAQGAVLAQVPIPIPLTLPARTTSFGLPARTTGLTLPARSTSITLPER